MQEDLDMVVGVVVVVVVVVVAAIIVNHDTGHT